MTYLGEAQHLEQLLKQNISLCSICTATYMISEVATLLGFWHSVHSLQPVVSMRSAPQLIFPRNTAGQGSIRPIAHQRATSTPVASASSEAQERLAQDKPLEIRKARVLVRWLLLCSARHINKRQLCCSQLPEMMLRSWAEEQPHGMRAERRLLPT